jgi:acetyl esterase/lipase
MPLRYLLLAALPLAASAEAILAPVATPAPITWAEVQARPLPPAGETRAYGPAAEQRGEWFAPSAAGAAPAAVILHGGCWLNAFDARYQRHLAAALHARGWAVWLPEYRRLGDEGGGWPGTLQDVGAAIDHLRVLAAEQPEDRPLDLRQLIVIGHSAGGQLALWSATRERLAPPLFSEAPLIPRGVVGLAAITDLAEYRIGPANSCHASVDRLLGGSPEARPERYAATSPRQRLPLGVPVLLIQGLQDLIVSPESVQAYTEAARAAGDAVMLAELPGGHFDVALPGEDVLATFERWVGALRRP